MKKKLLFVGIVTGIIVGIAIAQKRRKQKVFNNYYSETDNSRS